MNTILDIEKMTESKNFKSPKSTKDMEKIFEKPYLGPYGSLLEGDLPVPNKVHSSLATWLISKNNHFSEYLVSTNEIKEYNYRLRLDIGFDKSYFLGGESGSEKTENEAERPDYVGNFRKPKTASTNEIENPMEPSTTGLSPYISNGCLSVRLVWNECAKVRDELEHSASRIVTWATNVLKMFYLLSRHIENWDDDQNNSNCIPIEWEISMKKN